MRLGDIERQRVADGHEQRQRQLNRGRGIWRRLECRTATRRARADRRTAIYSDASSGTSPRAVTRSGTNACAFAESDASSRACSNTNTNADTNAYAYAGTACAPAAATGAKSDDDQWHRSERLRPLSRDQLHGEWHTGRDEQVDDFHGRQMRQAQERHGRVGNRAAVQRDDQRKRDSDLQGLMSSKIVRGDWCSVFSSFCHYCRVSSAKAIQESCG